MTYVIHARNVSEALFLGKQVMEQYGVPVQTRNGPALEMPWPVCTVYTHPKERVLFYPERDANPFFHFMESLWMLAGRRDSEFVSEFSGNIGNYADPNGLFWGAYGHRWRYFFDKDQLDILVHRLKTYPNDRRSVLAMWDARSDLSPDNDGLDYPCNTHIYLAVRSGRLNMMVCNRSNDMIWGAYGANAVHMSVLQEYLAARIGVQVGRYEQLSFNFHAYLSTFEKIKDMEADYDPYLYIEYGPRYVPPPLVECPEKFDSELHLWIREPAMIRNYSNPVFSRLAVPMYRAWQCYKAGNYPGALEYLEAFHDHAWAKACREWIFRRSAFKAWDEARRKQ